MMGISSWHHVDVFNIKLVLILKTSTKLTQKLTASPKVVSPSFQNKTRSLWPPRQFSPNMNSHPQLLRRLNLLENKPPRGVLPQDHWDCHKGRLPGPNCSTNCWAFRSSTSKPPKSPPHEGVKSHSTRNSLDSSHHSWCKMLRYIQVWYNDNILMTYDWHMCMWYDLYWHVVCC